MRGCSPRPAAAMAWRLRAVPVPLCYYAVNSQYHHSGSTFSGKHIDAVSAAQRCVPQSATSTHGNTSYVCIQVCIPSQHEHNQRQVQETAFSHHSQVLVGAGVGSGPLARGSFPNESSFRPVRSRRGYEIVPPLALPRMARVSDGWCFFFASSASSGTRSLYLHSIKLAWKGITVLSTTYCHKVGCQCNPNSAACSLVMAVWLRRCVPQGKRRTHHRRRCARSHRAPSRRQVPPAQFASLPW